jgi:hypothetical protein
VAEGTGLAGDAAAVDAGPDVVGRVGAGERERRGRDRPQRAAREVLLDRPSVHRHGAGARDEHYARDRRLSLARAAVGDRRVGHQDATSIGTGL